MQDVQRPAPPEEPGVQNGEYIVVKALEDGVSIIGMTRGASTRLHHTEKLDAGEVLIAQFTQVTSAMKVRGLSLIHI